MLPPMTAAPAQPQQTGPVQRLAGIAALAVALGFGVQALVLVAKMLAGGYVPQAVLLVDVASGVAWSAVVCLGTSLGVTAARDRTAVAGLVAALFGPLAVAAAKAANQAMAAAIGIILKPGVVPLVALAGLKSLEYGVLGYLLARLAARDEPRLKPYALTGLAVGLLFGAAALGLRLWAGTATPADIAAAAVNEAVFPVGCAAVVYVGRMMGRV
jgi:hypothetical protein